MTCEGEDRRPVLFYGHTHGPYCSFSNFYPSVFRDEAAGLTYCCTEQWLMHHKAMTFGDTAIARLVMANTDPAAIKALGRRVQRYDDAVWAACREDVMLRGLLLKFGQNADIRAVLLGTGTRPIAEASPTDRIFGIGAGASDPLAQNPDNWSSMGTSLLFFFLLFSFFSSFHIPLCLTLCHRHPWPFVDEVPRDSACTRAPVTFFPFPFPTAFFFLFPSFSFFPKNSHKRAD